MRKKVAVVDYDMGNIDSVLRALEECGAEPRVASSGNDFDSAHAIILPGVGSFADGIKNIRERGLDEILSDQVIRKQVPFLGICLGMQLLADRGWEGGETKGLGWIPGEVRQLVPAGKEERIPHMGWNELAFRKDSPLFAGIPPEKDFYFVHSYHFCPADARHVLARTPYCGEFVSAVVKDNILGVQFHPEKSQKTGFQLLRNFLNLPGGLC